MKNKHCCSYMYEKIENWECDVHKYRFECPDAVMSYDEVFDEYGLTIHGEPAVIRIKFCPWCGSMLPESMRDRWFSELEKLGYDDPLFNDKIPETYKTKAWREK